MVSYILTIQERLKATGSSPRELTKRPGHPEGTVRPPRMQSRVSTWYQVLVLLPTSTNKLLAGWQGPYTVFRQVSPINYEIEITDARKKRRIFHINMLRQWHSPCALTLLAEEVSEEHCDEVNNHVAFWNDGDETLEDPTIGGNLAPEERGLDNLLQEFRDVFRNKLGAEYCIRM